MGDALPDDEEEGEDLFGNDMMDDYRHDPALDQYDSWIDEERTGRETICCKK